MTPSPAIDIHQHLWPSELIDALRARTTPPRLDGWTLLLDGEPANQVDPDDHDPERRRGPDQHRIVLGLSSPLGIEDLPPADGAALLAAWHDGVARLRPDFEAWASVGRIEPDLDDLAKRLTDGFVGLQIPATWLATPRALDRLAGTLAVAAAADRPVFVHPGPVSSIAATSADATSIDATSIDATSIDAGAIQDDLRPAWWAAVVDYPSQLSAAWWSWHAAGRSLFPDLRICFAAGAGLAPVHHERYLARGGRPLVVDQHTFIDTSSYARQGVDSLIRVLGVDPIVIGSDRPYGTAFQTDQGDAAATAFRYTNPLRLLEGTRT
jgi:hypothetical protein